MGGSVGVSLSHRTQKKVQISVEFWVVQTKSNMHQKQTTTKNNDDYDDDDEKKITSNEFI